MLSLILKMFSPYHDILKFDEKVADYKDLGLYDDSIFGNYRKTLESSSFISSLLNKSKRLIRPGNFMLQMKMY